MKTLTDTDIVQFFYDSFVLPPDPKEAERLLLRIKELAEAVLVGVWNDQ